MTPRERYLAMLSSWPHWVCISDGVVLLTGDGEARVDMAYRLMNAGPAQTLIITGGLDNPPYSLPAKQLRAKALGLGVGPGKIIVDSGAQNTREQAVFVAAMAKMRGWKRIAIVASPDHMARAHLTFVRALDEAGIADRVYAVPVSAPLLWGETPAGRDRPRLDLFADECAKVDGYAEHVATWERGIEYLLAWEARRDTV
jgi:uncharacterized SAM-binding protein YcdF (DUF218 family)